MKVSELKKKLKQVGFLVLMLTVVSLVTYLSMSFRSKYLLDGDYNKRPANSAEISEEELIRSAQQIEIEPEVYVVPTDNTKPSSTIDTNFTIPNGGEAVMGVDNEFDNDISGCDDSNAESSECSDDFIIKYQPVCSRTTVNISYAGDGSNPSPVGDAGFNVSKNASIEIWKITSPLPILSGSERITTTAYSIDDKNSNKPDGGHILKESQNGGQWVAPAEDKENLVKQVVSADRESFAIHAVLDWKSGDSTRSQGNPEEVTINKELEAVCEEQPSDPNPDPSNKVADYIMNVLAAPNQPIEPRSYSDETGEVPCLDLGGGDLGTIDYIAEADIFETCSNQRSSFDGVISRFVQAVKWAECKTNPGACVTTPVVGIFIDAIYGANHKCNEGFCADQYLDNSLASTIAPIELSNWVDDVGDPDDPTIKPFYVATPCKIRVVDNELNGIYDIPCIWDISPYKHQYDLEAGVRFPGDEEWPTWQDHKTQFINEARERGQICSVDAL